MMLRAIATDEGESSDARRLMAGLSSRSLEEQRAAALALHDFFETDTQEMAPQEVEGFLAETFRGLERLLASAETHHMTGAVVAIDALMEVEAEDATSVRGDRSWLPRFAKYLRTALAHEANTVETLHLACDALGHLARAGGSLTTEVVDDEAKRALDVLRDEQAAPRGQRGRGGSSRERNADEMRALGAALVLRALAENAPTVMYARAG
jgi:FKBP12-rapamycin complex-associated protein